jgi:hypothetical protein
MSLSSHTYSLNHSIISVNSTVKQNQFLILCKKQGIPNLYQPPISFASDLNRSLFLDNQDLSLVIRFIEVKGSINKNGSINLSGNEQRRATESQQKYYLYRVYEENPGEFEMVELCDPLDEKSAGKWQYLINPFQSKRTKRYDIIEEEEA